jgi:Rieske 2Fe-2S family protein
MTAPTQPLNDYLGTAPHPAAPGANDLDQLIARRLPGHSLEQPFYVSEEIFKTDMERVWKRNWLFAGFSCQMPNPGDYLTYQVGNDSLLFLRGKDGVVRGFYNVCRHRGSVICKEDAGHVTNLVCPYHQWVYDLDGKLKLGRHMEPDFDKEPWGLIAFPVRECEGFIWGCPSENPPDFAPMQKGLEHHLKIHQLGEAKVAHTLKKRVRANWKLMVENFRECYHCDGAHPEYCGSVISAAVLNSKANAAEEQLIDKEERARWEASGVPSDSEWFTTDSWWLFWRFPLRRGFKSLTKDGSPAGPLMGDFKDHMGVMAVTTCPGTWLEASSDYAMIIRITPVSALYTDLDMTWLVRGDAVAGKDYDLEKVTAVWTATGGQDTRLCEDNQRGVDSQAYRPGPYAPSEGGTEVFVQWYLKQLQKNA